MAENEKKRIKLPRKYKTLKLEEDYEGVEIVVRTSVKWKTLVDTGADGIGLLTEFVQGGNFLLDDGEPFPDNPTRKDIENLPYDMIHQLLKKINEEVLGISKKLNTN